MKIPVSWVKDFVDITVSAQQLADDLTSVGLACDGIEWFGDEAVLDLDITTNRVDAMNMYGVAREAAALYGLPLKPLVLSFAEAGAPSFIETAKSPKFRLSGCSSMNTYASDAPFRARSVSFRKTTYFFFVTKLSQSSREFMA